MNRIPTWVRAGCLAGAAIAALALTPSLAPLTSSLAQQPDPSLHAGPLLYETYCRTCHDDQVHWRDGRKVRNWTMLVHEVDRWQRNLGLGWTDPEIRQVAHYINLRYYRFAPGPPDVIVEAGP